MKRVFPPKPKTEEFVHQLECFYLTFKKVFAEEDVHFDLSKLEWVTPLVLLPIVAHLRETRSEYTPPSSTDVRDYLKNVHFPEGTHSLNALQRSKKYIPVSLIERGQQPQDRNEILYCFLNLFYKTIGSIKGTKSALFYSPTELVGNIFEHSHKNYGFVFGQIYSKKGYLDLCILDRGRGLAKSFKDEKGLDVTHLDAIRYAMSGYSTKPGVDRGFGVRTSRNMVCEALHGEFTMITGNACLLSKFGEKDKLFILPELNWQGVVLSYRIPFPRVPIEYVKYIE